jgi:SPP1 family predicted phage head-tail adaptor
VRSLKDKKIILYRAEHIKDKDGFSTAKYTPLHSGRLWAYVRQLSAGEIYAARAVHQTEEMLFTINWRGDVTPDCYIEYRGIFYNITRVDTFEGYKEDLKIYAAKLATQQGAAGDGW